MSTSSISISLFSFTASEATGCRGILVEVAQPEQTGKVFTPPPPANVSQPTGIVAAGGPNAGSTVSDRLYPNTVASGAE